MTRDEAKTIRACLDAELAALGEKLGLKLTLGSCSFSATATFKLEAAPLKADGTAVRKEAEDFKALGGLFGFEPEDLGKAFHYNGRSFRLAGLLPKCHRFPILAADATTGKEFKLPAEGVRRALGKNAPLSR
jgi:hypothetical protein